MGSKSTEVIFESNHIIHTKYIGLKMHGHKHFPITYSEVISLSRAAVSWILENAENRIMGVQRPLGGLISEKKFLQE